MPDSATWDLGSHRRVERHGAATSGVDAHRVRHATTLGCVSEKPALWWAVTIDCHEPRRLGRFWAELLATPMMDAGPDRPGWVRLQPLASHGPFINFQPVQERKVGKLRLHLDVLVRDLESGAERVVALGGTDTGRRETLSRGSIAVMLDPEGKEFCVLAPPTP